MGMHIIDIKGSSGK